jgi:6-pyruvoyltetrahydropterin/6-carboxytetrahydropterin synthase
MNSICKRFEFCYGHKLPDYEGKCQFQHGHNAILEVEVCGRETTAYPTMIMDFKDLKFLVTTVLDNIDHQDLTDFFAPDPATAEVILDYLVREIRMNLPEGVELARLRVTETPDSWAEWKERM